jgi:phosphomevalonate kinase
VCIHCERDCQAKGIKPEKKKTSKFICLFPECKNLHSYYCSNCTDHHEHKAFKISVVLEELRKLGEEVDKVNERIMTVHQKAMKEKRSFDEIISLYSA